MVVQSGTLLFVVGTTALTLPSLMSTYYLNLGLSSPLFSPAYIRQHGFFTFQSRPSFAISGPSTSLVTHMFHHVDIMHWMNNMFAITISAFSLDLGLIATSIVFFGGGIAGALSQALERLLFRDAQGNFSLQPICDTITTLWCTTTDWILRRPSQDQPIVGYFSRLFFPTYAICGASGGAFALTGAEFYLIYAEIWRILTNRDKFKRDARHKRLANLIAMLFQRALGVGVQMAALLDLFGMGADRSVFSDMVPQIGHSAHVGGFLSGVAIMSVIDWVF
ncbi:hypothetical protein BDV3_003613 [Batrachochytrium dendrobatidis]